MLTKGGRSHPLVIYVNVMWRSAAWPFFFFFSSLWLKEHECLFFPQCFCLSTAIMQTRWTTAISPQSADFTRQLHHLSTKYKKDNQPVSAAVPLPSRLQTETVFFITLCFKDVFLFTSNSTQTQRWVDSQVWALAWYSNKGKAAYNNSHMKCHSSPSCMRYWLLTHSDTRAVFPAENIFEFTDWPQDPLPSAPCDSIYSKWVLCNWKECRDSLVEGCCAFELQSLTFHPLCPDHGNDKKAVALRLRTSFLSPSNQPAPECQRVISGRQWRRRQAKSSSCTQTQPFSHQCVSGRQRREAHCARWLVVGTRSLHRLQERNHFGWSKQQSG